MSGQVTCEVRGAVGVICLNNPPVNAITLAMLNDLDTHLTWLAQAEEVTVVILTGAGLRAFSAGSDLNEFPRFMDGPGLVAGKLVLENKIFDKLADLPKPVICALDGLAYGGGLELALCADIRIAAEDIRFALPESKLGGFPASGACRRLPKIVGASATKLMVFTGNPISANEALRIGLVNQIVPSGQAMQAALQLASTLVERTLQGLASAKQLIDCTLAPRSEEACALEFRLADEVFATDEMRRRVASFLDKRSLPG